MNINYKYLFAMLKLFKISLLFHLCQIEFYYQYLQFDINNIELLTFLLLIIYY